MSTVSDIIVFLENFAPPDLAEDWDNTGLLIGRRSASVKKVLTCLTLPPDVAEEAVSQGVQMVVSHHPVLFRGTKQITDSDVEGRMLLSLIESQIAVYSPHTRFDSAVGGINQQLAESFGLKSIKPIRPCEMDNGCGGGRYGTVSERISLREFLDVARSAVGAGYLEFCGGDDAQVMTVAVACGAAGEFLDDAIQLGCDTFVTGETRFHSALEARNSSISLILLGHYSSERPAVESLARTLAGQFLDLTVFASRAESDPLSVFPS